MAARDPDTDQLLTAVRRGDSSARGRLLDRHRNRLRGLVAVRMDQRLAARVDPSDLVQETLTEAHQRLDEYLTERPLPFYPWLRQIAVDRLIDLHRRHVRAGKRTISREEVSGLPINDASTNQLAQRLRGSISSPSARLRNEDSSRTLRAALEQLTQRDREVLVLRHLEQMAPKEIAAVLGITEAAVYTRHLRALERLRKLLEASQGGARS